MNSGDYINIQPSELKFACEYNLSTFPPSCFFPTFHFGSLQNFLKRVISFPTVALGELMNLWWELFIFPDYASDFLFPLLLYFYSSFVSDHHGSTCLGFEFVKH